MSIYSTNKFAVLAAKALGYEGLTIKQYRALCAAIRMNSGIDFADWRPSWADLTEPQHADLLTNLRYAFPGVRDGEAFVAFVRHMLSAYKGESNRGVRAAPSGSDGATGEPIQESGGAGAMAKVQTL